MHNDRGSPHHYSLVDYTLNMLDKLTVLYFLYWNFLNRDGKRKAIVYNFCVQYTSTFLKAVFAILVSQMLYNVHICISILTDICKFCIIVLVLYNIHESFM